MKYDVFDSFVILLHFRTHMVIFQEGRSIMALTTARIIQFTMTSNRYIVEMINQEMYE